MRIVAVVVVLAACGNGNLSITSEVKTESTAIEGLPGDGLATFADANPKLEVTGATGAIADGIKTALAKSSRASKGAIAVGVKGMPDSPSKSGKLDVTLECVAVFAHSPNLTKLVATHAVHINYSNATPAQLGEELGNVVAKWIDGEKLPADLGLPPPPAPVIDIAGGPPSCTLHADGNVRCWSEDHRALLIPAAHDTIAIAAASSFGACGVRKNGTAWCLDAFGSTLAMEARDVCGVTDATAISVGQSSACALYKTGQVTCWPRDAAAFAPCGATPMTATVTGFSDATAISVDAFTSCAIEKDGGVACWPSAFDPAHPPIAKRVKELSHATAVTDSGQPCALVSPTTIRCAATNEAKAIRYESPEPVKTLGNAMIGNVCVLTVPGNLYCDANGKLEKRAEVSDAVAWSGKSIDSCAVTKAGVVTCWGGPSGNDPAKPVAMQ